MRTAIKPIFIFSLPRSGSTLLQRILASHPNVGTAPETWVLIPQFEAFAADGVYSWSNHAFARAALSTFCSKLPEGQDTYNKALKAFILNLYRQAAPNEATHFIDKTPRYHLFAQQIITLFPEAHFIFLWRNPLSILSSIVDSWHHNHWHIAPYEIDLYEGLSILTRVYAANQHRVLAINYENISDFGSDDWQQIFAALGLNHTSDIFERYSSTKLDGIMGDDNAKQKTYIDDTSAIKWGKALNNAYRQKWARNYLDWLGTDRLDLMGYNKNDLLTELDRIPLTAKNLISDIFISMFQATSKWFELRLMRSRFRRVVNKQRHYPIFSNYEPPNQLL